MARRRSARGATSPRPVTRAWRGNSVIFITWDESDFTGTGPLGFGDTSGCCDAVPGGGHVVTLVISRSVRRAGSSGDVGRGSDLYASRGHGSVCVLLHWAHPPFELVRLSLRCSIRMD